MLRFNTRWWVAVCAGAFLAYFVLLVYCDLWRPESEGLSMTTGRVGLRVVSVVAGSPADRAGLRPGDEITRAYGQPIRLRIDWMAHDARLRLDEPMPVEVDRDGVRLTAAIRLSRGSWAHWRTREGVELLGTRVVQAVTLALGILVLLRRARDPVGCLGGGLLCAFGVYCVVLPYRIADVWAGLPPLLGVLLWGPFTATLVIPALLLSFFLVFPTVQRRSALWWLAVWAPMAAAAGWHLRYHGAVVYGSRFEPLPPHGLDWLVGVSIGYLVASMLAVAVRYRRLRDANERRRLRVLLVACAVGALGGGPIVLAYWRHPHLGLFASPALAVAALALLIVPLSFAYAILRHRLFDLRFMVRQGVRHALARRLLLSVVPALVLVLVVDVYLHRDQAVVDLLGTRATVYTVIAGLALFAHFQRQRWLDALDRRFFRERYDADRLLHRLVDDLERADALDRAASRAVEQISQALHARFVTVLGRRREQSRYRVLAHTPAGLPPAELSVEAKTLALARLIGRPMDVSADQSSWLVEHLPSPEVASLAAAQIDLVVSITDAGGGWDGVLVLGPRRSEEPYAREDHDWLAAVAARLAGVVAREAPAGSDTAAFGECPSCGACGDRVAGACGSDGALLTRVDLPRLLAGRYRLDHRIGRGGMGVVYAATDLSLEREVAVKVLREELVGNPESAERFRREARVSAGFSHPHVVTVFDYGVIAGSRGYLVMERLHGTTLREHLEQDGAVSPIRARTIMRAICGATEAAHRRHLVHRDLKPENVVLAVGDGGECPKVLDFGIAKIVATGSGASDPSTTRGIVGTPLYMAPEQLRGGSPEPSWDIWALAVIAFELLTGRHPFATPALTLSGIVLPGGPGAIPAGPVVPVGSWQAFFDRALAADPAHRPDTAAALLAGLEAAIEEGGDART